jgi:hypothetical protein
LHPLGDDWVDVDQDVQDELPHNDNLTAQPHERSRGGSRQQVGRRLTREFGVGPDDEPEATMESGI